MLVGCVAAKQLPFWLITLERQVRILTRYTLIHLLYMQLALQGYGLSANCAIWVSV